MGGGGFYEYIWVQGFPGGVYLRLEGVQRKCIHILHRFFKKGKVSCIVIPRKLYKKWKINGVIQKMTTLNRRNKSNGKGHVRGVSATALQPLAMPILCASIRWYGLSGRVGHMWSVAQYNWDCPFRTTPTILCSCKLIGLFYVHPAAMSWSPQIKGHAGQRRI